MKYGHPIDATNDKAKEHLVHFRVVYWRSL